MPPIDQIKKDDSNNGIDKQWTKVFFHIFKDGSGLLNLPRLMYAKKSWSLKELHLNFFHNVKDLLGRWLKEVQLDGRSNNCR
jgi:hypothetical protein